MKKLKLSLVLIVWNEKKCSEVIVPKIDLSKFDEVYAIDGGSSDGTQEFYESRGIPVYQQAKKGLGEATFEARRRCTTDVMLFFHPDGNENYEDLYNFRKFLEEGADLVIPSRMIKGARNEEDDKILRWRKWANIAFVQIANLIWGSKNCRATDPTQGFRAITVKAYDKLKLDQSDLTIDYHMVIRALKARIKISEFPTQEGERLFGDTAFPSISTGLKELRMLLREIHLGRKVVKS